MFIEVTEILCCPAGHEESYVVCVPIEMDGRSVVRGGIGCPVCHAEYPIVDGIAHFGGRAVPVPAAVSPSYDAVALQAFLDLEGKGGYALLLGSAGRHGEAIAALVPGVVFLGVNPRPDVRPSAAFSVLSAARAIPVKTRSVRAVVIGADHAVEPWLGEAVRVLLPGLRIVIEHDAAGPEGIAVLARADGLLVGEKGRG